MSCLVWDKGVRDELLHSVSWDKPFSSGLYCCWSNGFILWWTLIIYLSWRFDGGDRYKSLFLGGNAYLGIVSPYSQEVVVRDATFEVGSFLDWLIFIVPTNKRICNKFDDFYIPFYKCIFVKLGVWLPLTTFENEVRSYPKNLPYPSQCSSRSVTIIHMHIFIFNHFTCIGIIHDKRTCILDSRYNYVYLVKLRVSKNLWATQPS